MSFSLKTLKKFALQRDFQFNLSFFVFASPSSYSIIVSGMIKEKTEFREQDVLISK